LIVTGIASQKPQVHDHLWLSIRIDEFLAKLKVQANSITVP